MGRLTHRTAPGSTYFVTTKTWQNRAIFQVEENAQILLDSLIHYRDEGSYALHEFVIMPDHLHLLLTPGHDIALEKCIQLIKGGSSYRIHQRRGNKVQLWSPGFHEITIGDAQNMEIRRRYIRMNPVHGSESNCRS